MRYLILLTSLAVFNGCNQNNDLKEKLANHYSNYNHIEVEKEDVYFESINSIYLVGYLHSKREYDIGVISPNFNSNSFVLGSNCSIRNVKLVEPIIFQLYQDGNRISQINFSDNDMCDIKYLDAENKHITLSISTSR